MKSTNSDGQAGCDSPQASTRMGIAVLAIVGAISALSLWLGRASLALDPDGYAQLATTLADSGTFGIQGPDGAVSPTAYRPILYPWLLRWCVTDGQINLSVVAIVHWFMACSLAMCLWDIGRKLQIQWPQVPAVLVVLDPLLMRASQQVMTESLATLLAAIVWWLWLVLWPPNSNCGLTSASKRRSRNQWAALYLLGLAFGLSILVRPTAALWVAMFGICMLRVGCTCWKRRLIDLITVCVGVAVCVVPWTLRNWSTIGEPIWGTTHGGYTLLLANNPSIYRHFSENGPHRDWQAERFHAAWAARGKVDRAQLMSDRYWLDGLGQASTEMPSTESAKSATGPQISNDSSSDPTRANQHQALRVYSLGELQDDRLAYEVAHNTIHQHTGQFALSCVYRLGWFWSCWPSGVGPIQTALIGTWYCIVFCLAVIGLRRNFAKLELFLASWLPALVLLIVLSGVHCVYWSNMRMRCPLMACVYLLAVVALQKRET